MPERGRVILAGAILSILLNPLFSPRSTDGWRSRRATTGAGRHAGRAQETAAREPVPLTALTDHVVLVGHGRVGSFVSAGLPADTALLVIEDDADRVAALKSAGREAIVGNAAHPDVIRAANLSAARCLLVAIPDAFEGGQVVAQARDLNPPFRSSRVPIPRAKSSISRSTAPLRW